MASTAIIKIAFPHSFMRYTEGWQCFLADLCLIKIAPFWAQMSFLCRGTEIISMWPLLLTSSPLHSVMEIPGHNLFFSQAQGRAQLHSTYLSEVLKGLDLVPEPPKGRKREKRIILKPNFHIITGRKKLLLIPNNWVVVLFSLIRF